MTLVHRVRDHDFSDVVLGAARPVLVGFHADWSRPCRQVGAVLDELAVELPWLGFVRLDVDTDPLTPATYDVTGLPSLLAFDRGEVVLSVIGTRPKQTLRELFLGLRGSQRV
ncbi:co-chaperone YbbN [Nocardioides sp. SYSU D00038]|uniref:thioredoxin family protein n=1 Tax=Nocardioides sp. SYSU D00038 TaxID=2812554 RepID=UPI001968015A|nr:thioredoxin domain-containing protein [Nocardioides sp. SYSU D00038]